MTLDRFEQDAGDGLRRDILRERALRRIAMVHVVGLALVVIVATLWLFSDVLLLLFAATLFACQLRGAARLLGRRLHLSHGLALTAVVLILAAAFATAFYFRGPAILSELATVYDEINKQALTLWKHFGHADWAQNALDRVSAYLGNNGKVLAGRAAGLVTTTIGSVGSALLIMVAAIYLAAAPDIYQEGIVRLMPGSWRERTAQLLIEEGRTLRRWFLGQLVDMAAIGVMTGVGLWLLGVPLFPTLALIAALCNFVPYIGALAGSVPAIVVGLGQSPQTALWVALLFVVVQSIEGNLISPLISRRTVDLPPVLTLFSQTVLGALFGPLGLILATPITAVVLVLVKRVYVESVLDKTPQL